MSLIRVDHYLPKLLASQPTDGSTTITSTPQLLNGAVSVTLQFVLTGGAAGTCYAEASNDEPTDPNLVWVPCQSFTLSANNVGTMVFSAVDQLTGMHTFRIRFVPSAAGNIRVACNLRHYSN